VHMLCEQELQPPEAAQRLVRYKPHALVAQGRMH
jgi:hypothetical protein